MIKGILKPSNYKKVGRNDFVEEGDLTRELFLTSWVGCWNVVRVGHYYSRGSYERDATIIELESVRAF